MARMFPTPLPAKAEEDPFRSAERRVYEALAATLPKSTTVFYGAAWLGRRADRAPVDGEADFIVAHPDDGLLVLEVKGGGIARDGGTGQWSSRDRTGRVHRIKDPLDQAVRSKHALLQKLRDLPGFPAWVDAGHGVVLPDSRRSARLLGPAAPSDIVAFADDMDRLGTRVHGMIRFWASGNGRYGLGNAGVEALVRLLAPTFELPVPAGPALEEDDRTILRLTEEQFSVLDLLSRMREVAVTGGAGTGKTILAREKARRLAAEGFRTLLTCSSPPLAGALAAQCRDTPSLTVRCFGALCREFAAGAGVALPEGASEASVARGFLEALDRRPDDRFDAIVVDEGQDFGEDRWDLLRLALDDEESGILYVFYDDNQRLKPACSRFLAGLPAVTLTKNLRNTRAIYEAASPFFACGTLEAAGPEGRPVEHVAVVRPELLEREVGRVLHRLIREELVPAEQVAVLTAKAKSALGTSGRIGAFACGTTPEKGKVRLGTVDGFKGLESRVVVCAEIEEVLDAPETLYVALTRARAHLVVVATGAAIESIRSRHPGELVCRACS